MIDRLTVKYHGKPVGMLSLAPDDRQCVFEYFCPSGQMLFFTFLFA